MMDEESALVVVIKAVGIIAFFTAPWVWMFDPSYAVICGLLAIAAPLIAGVKP